MEKFDSKKGYGINRIVLMLRDPNTLYAYWEIGKKEQEQIERVKNDKKSKLVLRLHKIGSSKIYNIRINKDNSLGSYYIKSDNGVRPNHRYYAEMGILKNSVYSAMVPKSNIVKTPSDRLSKETSINWYDPRINEITIDKRKRKGCRESKERKHR